MVFSIPICYCRRQDPIWTYFRRTESKGGKGYRAQCKACDTEIVSRMKANRTNKYTDKATCSVNEEQPSNVDSLLTRSERAQTIRLFQIHCC